MRIFAVMLLLVMACMAGDVSAAEPRTEHQVQRELIDKLEADGFLSHEQAAQASQKYAGANAAAVASTAAPTLWERTMTWMNFAKVLGVILLLLALGGTMIKITRGAWRLLARVPVLVYQVPFSAFSIYATIAPQTIWASQSIYVALLAAFANILLAGWVLATHRDFAKSMFALLDQVVPVASFLSFLALLYFGLLAVHYDSRIFGFFAAVSFSGMLSFGLYYMPGTLYLHFKRNALFALVFAHLAGLGLYVLLKAVNLYPQWAQVFQSGIEYYCTTALCVALLVGGSPFNYFRNARPLMVALFILLFAGSMTAYFFLDLTVIGSIVCCFFILFLLEWIAKLGYSGGVVLGSGVLGCALYATALLMEKYGSYIVLASQ